MSVVTFRPIGRLGNNMFQTAACIGYAKKYGYKWFIPATMPNGYTDPWLLPTFWPNLPMGDFNGQRYEQHDAKDFNYKPIPKFDRGVKLLGFFQSEKWFENAKEEVKAAFKLHTTPLFKNHISIHVRRGDYVTHSNSFPPVNLDYIDRAIAHIHHETGIAQFVVFSDDIEWCKSEFKKSIWKDFEWKYSHEENEKEALGVMASCSHHIIANSSFSWWGAWLGHNPDKIVVSPSADNWFGPGFTGSTPADLIPDSWKQIKFR